MKEFGATTWILWNDISRNRNSDQWYYCLSDYIKKVPYGSNKVSLIPIVVDHNVLG